MPNLSVLSLIMCFLSIPPSILSSSPCDNSSLSSSSNSTDDDLLLLLGTVFASPTIDHRPSFSMVLPEDSEYSVEEGTSSRHRRHVACGRKSRSKPEKISFEQRSICPFTHHRNVDYNRIPVLLEEVRCICHRPSHLSSYTDVRCQPLLYKVPVLRRQSSNDIYVQSVEELTLACIPLKPRDDASSDFMVDIKN